MHPFNHSTNKSSRARSVLRNLFSNKEWALPNKEFADFSLNDLVLHSDAHLLEGSSRKKNVTLLPFPAVILFKIHCRGKPGFGRYWRSFGRILFEMFFWFFLGHIDT